MKYQTSATDARLGSSLLIQVLKIKGNTRSARGKERANVCDLTASIGDNLNGAYVAAADRMHKAQFL